MCVGVVLRGGDKKQRDCAIVMAHDELNATQEGFSSDDSEGGNTQDLLFEYFRAPGYYPPLLIKVHLIPLLSIPWNTRLQEAMTSKTKNSTASLVNYENLDSNSSTPSANDFIENSLATNFSEYSKFPSHGMIYGG